MGAWGSRTPPDTTRLTPTVPPCSLHARCIYNASELLPLRLEVAVPPTAAPMAQPGPLRLQLRIATGERPRVAPPAAPLPTQRGPQPAQHRVVLQMRATAPTTRRASTPW